MHTAIPLAAVGGFLDAYTFVGYNGVFANAQTGNVVLLGMDAQAGRWREALLHVPPIVAFMPGVASAKEQYHDRDPAHRTRSVIGAAVSGEQR